MFVATLLLFQCPSCLMPITVCYQLPEQLRNTPAPEALDGECAYCHWRGRLEVEASVYQARTYVTYPEGFGPEDDLEMGKPPRLL